MLGTCSLCRAVGANLPEKLSWGPDHASQHAQTIMHGKGRLLQEGADGAVHT